MIYKKINGVICLVILMFLLMSCASIKSNKNDRSTVQSDNAELKSSASYQRGIEYSIEEKLAPVYKDSIKSLNKLNSE